MSARTHVNSDGLMVVVNEVVVVWVVYSGVGTNKLCFPQYGVLMLRMLWCLLYVVDHSCLVARWCVRAPVGGFVLLVTMAAVRGGGVVSGGGGVGGDGGVAAAAATGGGERFPCRAPVSCPVCGRVCSNKYILRTHMEDRHSGPQRLPCPHCSKEYSSRNSLLSHISRYHREREPGPVPLPTVDLLEPKSQMAPTHAPHHMLPPPSHHHHLDMVDHKPHLAHLSSQLPGPPH